MEGVFMRPKGTEKIHNDLCEFSMLFLGCLIPSLYSNDTLNKDPIL
jgi:hypothetical protein